VTVDAHIHLWRLARGDNVALLPDMTPIYRDLGPQDVKPRLDAAGVDRIVVVQAAETLAEALFITGLARKFPWITGIGSIHRRHPSRKRQRHSRGFPLSRA
jgi:L-fuconolactonase